MYDHERAGQLSRRGFLMSSIAAAIAAACADGADSPEPEAIGGPTGEPTDGVELATDPFTLGVTSGDPLDDSVILWTRLDPDVGLPAGDIEVDWVIGLDPELRQIVAAGVAPAQAALGHSVHANVDGLEADTVYHYRFSVGGWTSPVGRTRTFAAAGTTPERFRFAFSSCQNWEDVHYAAYRDLVEEGGLDAFVFLGDYIYENASGELQDPRGRLTGQAFDCRTLEQYRQRYALYRSDPLLQAAHASAPWLIVWDDHEVDNDYAAASSETDDEPAAFLRRRADAYQAWYEFMPVRLEPPTGPDYPIHRRHAHGDLVAFHLLDTRQYRSDQQRGGAVVQALGDAVQIRDDNLQFTDEHTILGAEQHEWLIDGIASSNAIWDALAQQVYMFGVNALPGSDPPIVVVDSWDGYAGERERLLNTTGTAAPAGADNLVVLTGDFHSAAVGLLRPDPFDPDQPPVGVEFMASSISSAFFDADPAVAALVDIALAANPQLRFFDRRPGYTVCEVTPEKWTATYRTVLDVFDPQSPVETISTWAVTAGVPNADRLD